jgi:hypothetical protein
VKKAHFVPPLLASATIILVLANALPSARRKHLLQEERQRLVQDLERERARERSLLMEVEALRSDPFYLERVTVDTWGTDPEGAVPFYSAADLRDPTID